MKRLELRRALTVALALGACLPALAGGRGAYAAPMRQATPLGVDAARPTVSGKLVAKAMNSAAPTAPVICGDRDRTPAAAALMINRGFVVCTGEGKLVLLQLSRGTGLFNRDWQRLAYGRFALGDHLNAWGILRAGGNVLNPTVAVQDLSKSGPHLQVVTGRLVAKPDAAPSGPVICGDRDRAPDVPTLMAQRGLVVCTAEGKLVLLQISSHTRIFARDRTGVTIADLTLGDPLTARGLLQAAGFVLNPTVTVVDTAIQRKYTASQDFIAGGGTILTLYVLKSDNGPVQGLVHAARGEPSHITLCAGIRGVWSDLKQGLTIDISNSIFNTRTMTYVDTNTIKVANCR